MTQIKRLVVIRIFGDVTHFWHRRFVQEWLPIILGLGLGIVLALLVSSRFWYLAVALVLAIPAAILFLNYPFVGVLVWILASPYFVSTLTSSERIMFWISHRAVPPIALFFTIISGVQGSRSRRSLRINSADWSMVLFLVVMLVNIFLFSGNLTKGLINAYDLIFIPFCMYWLIRALVSNDTDVKILLGVLIFTMVIQAAIGLASWFTPELLPPQWLGRVGSRVTGSLRNPAVYTSFMLFSGLLLLHYAMQSKSKVARLGLVSLFAIAVFTVYMSFSRGSWLGVTMVLICLMFLYPRIVIILVLFLVLIGLALGGTVLTDTLAWADQRLTASESAYSRITALDASIRMIEEKPFFGWGLGNFDEAKQQFLRRVGDIPVYGATSHNTYLSIAAELGLLGLFLYMYPLIYWLIISIKDWRRLPREGLLNSSLLPLLWLVILHMFVVTNFMDMIRFHAFGTTIWWMTLALIGNLVCTKERLGETKL